MMAGEKKAAAASVYMAGCAIVLARRFRSWSCRLPVMDTLVIILTCTAPSTAGAALAPGLTTPLRNVWPAKYRSPGANYSALYACRATPSLPSNCSAS